jgi:2-phosphoglycerate kinase
MSERRHVTPVPLGDEIPFSKGLMARALVVTGLDTERAYLIANRIDRDLAER